MRGGSRIRQAGQERDTAGEEHEGAGQDRGRAASAGRC